MSLSPLVLVLIHVFGTLAIASGFFALGIYVCRKNGGQP